MRLFYRIILVLLVVIGTMGIISLIFQIPLTQAQANTLGIFGFSFGGIAVVLALDAEEQLRRLKAGEVNEKLAILYGHAATICSSESQSQEFRNYYTARVVADVKAMQSIGRLGKGVREQVERASDNLLCEMLKRGYYTTELANELARITFEESHMSKNE